MRLDHIADNKQNDSYRAELIEDELWDFQKNIRNDLVF